MRSRFNFFIVILPCIFVAGFFALGLYFLSHPEMRLRNKAGGTNSAIAPGIFLTVCMGTVLFLLLKKIVWLKIERDRLLIRTIFFRRELPLSGIREICLLDRKSMSYGYTKYEAMTIRAEGEKEFVFYDLYYRNMPAMRACLQEWYPGLATPGYFKDRPVVSVSEPETFAGNFISNQNGIFLFVFFGLAVWMGKILLPLAVRGGAPLLGLSFLWLFFGCMLVMFARSLHYFRLENDELQIRNHIWFWYEKSYPLNEIAGVVFESPYRQSNGLRIRTRDLESVGYGAGSLRQRHWRALYERLRSLGVPVIREFNIGRIGSPEPGDGSPESDGRDTSADLRSTD